MMGIFRHCPCLRPQEDDVKTLDYSHCCLEDVPHTVFSHERTLEELCLDSNQIRDLPRPLFHCEGLRKLALSDNELQSVPPAISSLTKLEELNISKNHILQIPDSIKGCKCLMIVEASINPLGPRLPDGFTQLINLQELYLNDTFLEFLPANFGRLSRLQIVELRENHLKALPKSMVRLVELRRLDIGQNDFLEFPEVVGSLPKLTELWCDCNRIISLPSSLGNLKQLNYLDASNNKIEEIAPELGECTSLTDLTLSCNNLVELPESICNLINLTILRFDENEIKSLPSSIGSLSSLEELVFNENEVETIPSSIGCLRNLHTLIADANKLKELPASIGSCMQLRIISLAENELRVLPDEIGRLSCLKVLNLNSNLITYLPFTLTKINNLQALWLSENQHKPLIQLQSDFDSESGQKVLTCFLLPQVPLQLKNNSITPKSVTSPNEPANNSTEEKQVIKFLTDSSKPEDEDDDSSITPKLIRAPTPYPKELKAHARHARNLALKQKDPNASQTHSNDNNADSGLILATDGNGITNDVKSSHFEIKEAKVSKAPKSPSNPRRLSSSEDAETVTRPTSLQLNSTIKPPGNSLTNQKDAVNVDNIEIVASRLNQLLTTEEQTNSLNAEPPQRQHHERKASYKVAMAKPSNIMKSPVEQKIKQKEESVKDENDRGYRSDHELYSNERTTNGNTVSGYSSDWESTVLKSSPKKSLPKNNGIKTDEDVKSGTIDNKLESNLKYDSESACISSATVEPKSPLYKNNCPSNNKCNSISGEDITSMQSDANQLMPRESVDQKVPEVIISGQLVVTQVNDALSNSSITSLYPSSGSERAPSMSSLPSSYSSTASQHSSISPNDVTLTENEPQPPALPPKPVIQRTSVASPEQTGIPPPPASASRLRQPQSASSQFIIHKFSHDAYTQPRLPLVSNQTPLVPILQQDDNESKWSNNGFNFIDNSDDSVSSNSSGSVLNPNNHLSHRWLLGTHKNAHVFPVIIVKNPGLGFSIESGFANKNPINASPNKTMGIYVSNVVSNGPASTALKVGDKILQVDGIDLQHASKEKASDIFKSTGTTVSLMVSREKT